jgi:co-chaperonin GroES (HSP10)
MRALSNIIIVKEVKEVKKTKGGLLLTDKDSEEMRYQKGEVLTMGPDVRCVEEGNTIYYDKHRAYATSIEGQIVTVIRESDGVVVLD